MDIRYRVRKLNAPIHWVTEVPGSKSITNRALLMAALSDGEVALRGILFSDDSRCFLSSLQSLGFQVEIREEEKEATVCGLGGRIPNPTGEIYVGSAGTAARFLTAMLGVSEGTYVIQASEQMQRRPMKPLFEALLALGARMEWLGEPWHLPVRITGAGASEKIIRAESGEYQDGICGESGTYVDVAGQRNVFGDKEIREEPGKCVKTEGACGMPVLNLDISESTQFLSAFLLISPMFADGLRIHITSEKTDGSYIRITRRMMADFGVEAAFDGRDYVVGAHSVYEKNEYRIEPDVSAACYFYAAAAVTGGYAKVLHVHRDGMQGDLKFLSVLEQMGCHICEETDGISVRGARVLHGVSVDMNDFSDQALTLAAIAPYADAPVKIRNIAHIRGQECDRIHAIVSNLTRAGIVCEEYPDGVKIYPGAPKACRIETFGDHRVAMAFAVMGLRADGIEIENPMCCKKTFEHYFDVLDELMRG